MPGGSHHHGADGDLNDVGEWVLVLKGMCGYDTRPEFPFHFAVHPSFFHFFPRTMAAGSAPSQSTELAVLSSVINAAILSVLLTGERSF